MASLGIGPALKQERLRQKFEIDDISRLTRISHRFLEAIEDEDFARLPAMVFTRGFVRQYSTALNIDAEPLLAVLPKPDVEGAPLPVPPPGRPHKWDPRVKSALQTVMFLLLAAGAVTGAWLRYNHGPYFSFDTFGGSRPRSVGRASKPTAVPATARTVAAETLPAPREAEPLAVAPTPALTHAPNQAVELRLVAHAASWVQITADGRPEFTGMLQPSDVRIVGAKGNVRVTAGNAGGLDISLNGKKLDPIGPAGQVRSVTFTAEGLQPVVQNPPPSHDPF